MTSSALLRTKRRDIARILTVLNGRTHGIETQAQKKAAEAPAPAADDKKAKKAKAKKS